MNILTLLEDIATNAHYDSEILNSMKNQSPEVKKAFSENSNALLREQLSLATCTNFTQDKAAFCYADASYAVQA